MEMQVTDEMLEKILREQMRNKIDSIYRDRIIHFIFGIYSEMLQDMK